MPETVTTDTLYKIDSKGKIRTWYAKRTGNSYTTFAGLKDGRQITKQYTVTKPKRGSTSAGEQAEKDMRSKEKRKHERELYSYDLSLSHPKQFIAPMLARDYTKVGHQVKWGEESYCAQAKLDGVRTIAQYVNGEVKLTSRKGKEYDVPHIKEQLLQIYKTINQDTIFDGELYIHNMELGDITHKVSHGDINLEYHVFDLIDENVSFLDRLNKLNQILTNYKNNNSLSKIYIVNSYPITNDKTENMHDDFVSKGYEGLIIRNTNSKYEIGKRSISLFKYKKFITDEFKLIDIIPDKEDGCRFILQTTNNQTFTSRPMGTNEMRTKLLKEKQKFIGADVTVKFSKLLKTGIPEFNRSINTGSLIRNYE